MQAQIVAASNENAELNSNFPYLLDMREPKGA
jgi:hypothetical protein